ncbi:hypothetical protein CB0940_03442 [Cercospora beticola]|uniref:Malate dehydrogenase n=1 Tax=Cercospora beticola TaxID=122368 RepID=A0A2G5I4V1_CERBT|nr:hypothetical protein CB0940_03442 [Cercospora beticola]PIA99788.1 hypothetical protein CB0940_03442 [Cercospora beticola]WPB00617.1 hypothetical protein RHO25_005237 [Cercospora beticola]CAK1361160.1 unnamed protein product [Cercospora beticola]
MLFSIVSLLLAAGLVTAVPFQQQERRDAVGSWSRKNHNWAGRGSSRAAEQCSCDIASIQMPQAPKPLPPVSEGFSLYHIAVGRGTQNYTCDLSNATAVPAAAGAVATLVNATCLTANSPILAWSLAGWAYQDKSTSVPKTVPVNDFLKISGHHYFTDLTTAYFNLDTIGQGDDTWQSNYSQGGFKKINATDAPADAIEGSVPWLKLNSKDETKADDCAFQEVYRINTVGGAAPKTCEGQEAEFQVEYAAEYWFYGKPETSSY